MTNIPIYRAKKIDSDEYVEGCLYEEDTEFFIASKNMESSSKASKYEENMYQMTINDFRLIDPSTLAIHFSDTSSTQSEKVWYNMEEISNIIKEYEHGKMEKH